jgi:hypothetical protein
MVKQFSFRKLILFCLLPLLNKSIPTVLYLLHKDNNFKELFGDKIIGESFILFDEVVKNVFEVCEAIIMPLSII